VRVGQIDGRVVQQAEKVAHLVAHSRTQPDTVVIGQLHEARGSVPDRRDLVADASPQRQVLAVIVFPAQGEVPPVLPFEVERGDRLSRW
jgi:hypothetical protein